MGTTTTARPPAAVGAVAAPTATRRASTPLADGLRAGVRDMLPIVLAVVPFALVLGVAIDASVVPDVPGLLLAPVLYAGSANFATLAVLDAGGSAAAAVFAGLIVNVRFAMYGVALAARFRDQPQWFRWLGPWAIVDQTFAIAVDRAERSPAWFRAYWIAAAVVLGVGYTAGVAVGIVAGPVVPAGVGIELTIPALFVAMLVGKVRDRPALAAVVVGALATALALELPHGLALPVGALTGATAAVLTRRIP